MSSKKANPLPSRKSEDAVVSIAAFETGWMKIDASLAIAGLKGEFHGTSWRFFMQHAPSNTKFWFDLGVAHVRLIFGLPTPLTFGPLRLRLYR
jgi:hypothetical protein